MSRLFTKVFILLGLLFFTGVQAQECTYTLIMEDTFGDGWNGCTLTIEVDGVSTDYSMLGGDYEEVEFTVNEGDAVTLFYTQGAFNNEVSYILLDTEGTVLFTDGPGPIEGDVFETNVVCPTCFKIDLDSVVATPSNDSILVSWNAGMDSEGYVIEYGPVGFPIGSGVSFNTTDTFGMIPNLVLGCSYDIYIANDCGGGDVSSYAGPTTVLLPLMVGTSSCTYTLNLFDTFGDGWNGSILSISVDGVSTDYTFTTGTEETFELTFFENQIVTLSYAAGAFQNEVSYEILDSDGAVVFSDGTFPTVGTNIFSFVACSICSTPSSTITYVGYDQVQISWDENPDLENVMVEYGPAWFLPGTGQIATTTSNTITISGLNEVTDYHFYLVGACPGDLFGPKNGPLAATTFARIDVGIGSIDTEYSVCDLFSEGELTVGITGYGADPQSLIPVFYAIDGVTANIPMPQDGFYTGVVGFDSTELYTFETMFTLSTIGTHTLTAWTELDGDADPSNDTLRIEFEIVGRYLPLVADFETPIADYTDENWAFTGGNFNDGHNNTSFVYARNLFFAGATSTLETPPYGVINTGDNFTFDYRYSLWSLGTEAFELGGDSLNVFITADCGETWDMVYSITADNHTPTVDMTNISIDLADYVGDFIQIRMEGIYIGPGDYWLDIDNLNILSCGPDLGLLADITSVVDGDDGAIEILPEFGLAPFNVVWEDDGSTDNPRTGLAEGSYTATVTDDLGCTSTATFILNNITAVTDLGETINVKLSPNPVQNMLNIDLNFETSRAYNINIFNQQGQLLNTIDRAKTQNDNVQIDMTDYSAGMYYILLKGDGLVHHEKVVVIK